MNLATELFQKDVSDRLQRLNESLQLSSADRELSSPSEKNELVHTFFESAIAEFNGQGNPSSDQWLHHAVNKIFLDWWTVSFEEWKQTKKEVEPLLRARLMSVEKEFWTIETPSRYVDKSLEIKHSKCQHIFARGVRKGEACGKTTAIGLLMCSSHAKGKVYLLQHVNPEPLLQSDEGEN